MILNDRIDKRNQHRVEITKTLLPSLVLSPQIQKNLEFARTQTISMIIEEQSLNVRSQTGISSKYIDMQLDSLRTQSKMEEQQSN